MKRGDVVEVDWAFSDQTGSKVRPAVVARADHLSSTIDIGETMRHLWKRWWFWAMLTPAVLVVALLALSRHHRVYSWQGWEVYQAMENECHPAWREFNFRRVNAGDSVDDVIARTNPISTRRKGPWTVLGYTEPFHFTGMIAVAYDGKMVFAYAYSCCWTKLFFDEMSDAQSMEFFGFPKNHRERLGHTEIYR